MKPTARFCAYCANGFHYLCSGHAVAMGGTCECADRDHDPDVRTAAAMRLYQDPARKSQPVEVLATEYRNMTDGRNAPTSKPVTRRVTRTHTRSATMTMITDTGKKRVQPGEIIQDRKVRATGGRVTVERGMDEGWVLRCIAHSNSTTNPSRLPAEAQGSHPETFCDECKAIVEGNAPKVQDADLAAAAEAFGPQVDEVTVDERIVAAAIGAITDAVLPKRGYVVRAVEGYRTPDGTYTPMLVAARVFTKRKAAENNAQSDDVVLTVNEAKAQEALV